MSFLPSLLLAQIYACAKQLPPATLETIINLLATNEHCNATLKTSILKQLPNANFRRVVAELLETWCHEAGDLNGNTISSALAMASYCQVAAQDELSVELVWTGPTSEGVPLRKTEQVLLQIIRESKHELILVSFAVYKIPEITKALVAAIHRGVRVRIIAETPESSEGKISFKPSMSFGQKIAEKAQLFIWPQNKRLTDDEGRYGSLHVKCAISDAKHLFISSANLTEYALTLNMELGLLVHSQELANQVVEHIECLIQQGIFIPWQ
ncbi:DISARM system phospholipase D-like protein DrmC [Anabaena cylindrica UHCC 0172]|uniref:DISARM system phospholipase D-like protein DrmC n=1 Tax=Anabaena cylindrica TaxID=1165 RepID=UPI002B213978|nr:DISARM system phospholipase D-like protein DrmC [Anabaena cylindrica]MEA5551194.1 DISARM system phospholipase D-like protein DrmC [Anabaena cylindrica UHCC 0172]